MSPENVLEIHGLCDKLQVLSKKLKQVKEIKIRKIPTKGKDRKPRQHLSIYTTKHESNNEIRAFRNLKSYFKIQTG
jgi:hypothetical protein